MKYLRIYLIFLVAIPSIILFTPLETEAQRINRSASRGGRGVSRPASRPASSRANNVNRANTRNRPATSNRGTINGGSRQLPDRNISTADRGGNTNIRNNTSSRDRNTNVSGNRVNVDNSRRNVNINVDNSRDVNINRRTTVVRPNPRPYYRPPYRYGGFRFYAYRPYYYHPYRPFYWGPVWHPWGFFVATLAATAIIITVENQQYHYDQGVYYVESDGGYTVVQAPPGATIKVLPEGSETVVVNETTNNYYYGGTYYEESEEGYTVVPPTAGTVVENLPEGGEEVKVGEVTYVKLGETYYQPVQVDGENMYEVVNVEEDSDEE